MTTLAEKLQAAGLPFVSATEAGSVDCAGLTVTPEQREAITEIIMEHLDPLGYAKFVRVRNRLTASKIAAKAIPNWATWTQQEWTTYFNSNLSDSEADLVTSIAAARVMFKRQNLVINNLTKMVLALRDQIWPDLPEG